MGSFSIGSKFKQIDEPKVYFDAEISWVIFLRFEGLTRKAPHYGSLRECEVEEGSHE